MAVSAKSPYPTGYVEEPEIVLNDGAPANDNGSNFHDEENRHTKRQLRGAAAAGGIAGMCLGGPLLAAVGAAGGAYVVSDKGCVGNTARHCGDAVADFGVTVKRWNRKNQVTQKATKNVSKAADWAARRLKPKDVPSAASGSPYRNVV